MQSSSPRYLAIAAVAVALIVASACSSATQQRSWTESNGAIYSRCDNGAAAQTSTHASADPSIAPGDVRLSFVNAITGTPLPGVQVAHAYAQITPDSLTMSDNEGTLRLHYLQRSAVVIAVRALGWVADSVTVDTRSGNDVQFALHALCAP